MKGDNNHSRRQFLKKGIHSAALATMLPAGLNANCIFNMNKAEQDNFVYRTLGNTGIKLPIISMGTEATNNVKLIKAALDSGVKLLATSPYYANGNNEIVLGEAIKDRDRDSVYVATNGIPDGIDRKAGLFTNESKTEKFLKKIDESLKRLNVDYIDFFFLPFCAKRESVFFEPLLRAMEKAKELGKAKYIGIATHKFEDEAILAAIESRIYDVVMTSYNIREKKRDAIADAIEKAAQAGLGVFGMKTMAGGFWDKEKTQPLNTKASLKWVLQNKNIHTTVPGITTYEQLEQDISIMGDLELTEEEKYDLKLVQTESKNGLYCHWLHVWLSATRSLSY